MHAGRVYAALLAVASVASAAPTKRAADAPKALYFISNEAKNEVISLKVGADGKLSEGSRTATGGVGSAGFDAEVNATAGPDALFSQSALTVAGNTLFAVNAGCNTVSMMAIDPKDPTKLKAVGTPVDTLGEFPMSVTASTKNMQVCVANSGAKAGVACAAFCESTGIGEMDALRPFEINQKTPPVGPVNTVSQTFFNDDESAVLTTVKGDGKKNKGFLSSFKVANGKVSTKETRSSPAGTAVLFGSVNIPGTSQVLATDASFGAAVLDVGADAQATVANSLKIKDQKATCWATVSDATGTGFVTDVGVNHLVEMDLKTGKLVQDFESQNGNPGMIDLVAAGNMVYALSPGDAQTPTAVTAFDVSGGPGTIKEVQNFKPGGLQNGRSMGMKAL